MRRPRTYNRFITTFTDYRPATIAAAFASWQTAKHAQQ